MRLSYNKGRESPGWKPSLPASLALMAALFVHGPSFSQDPPLPQLEADSESPTSEESSQLPELHELNTEVDDYEHVDLVRKSQLDECYREPDAQLLPETVRAGLFTLSCRTVSWADSLFGNEKDFDEISFGGMLQVGAAWNQYEGVDGKLRFRLRTSLPNLSSRMNAFIGRVEEDREIEDRQLDQVPFNQAGGREDPSWLLGLGYRRPTKRNRWWDWDLGVRLRVPPRPFIRARYHVDQRIGEDSNFRFRQTFFWRQDRGLGTTSHFDFGQGLTPRDLLRWETVATWSEESIGVRWFSGATWYRQVDGPKGLALLSFARGETDSPIDVYEYGFVLTWRQPMGRPWMWINVGPTITWPRELVSEKRELSLGFAVLTEIEFGAWSPRG